MPERLPLLSALLLCCVVGCSPDAGGTESQNAAGGFTGTESALDSAMARYIAALESSDTAAISGVVTENVEVVFPTGPMRKGRSNAVEAFAELFESMTVRDLRPIDSQRMVRGDMAIETGAFEIALQPKTGDTASVTDRGYYLVVWERQADGSWKIARGFNRSDTPVEGAADAPSPTDR